jgi:hypothetical protein
VTASVAPRAKWLDFIPVISLAVVLAGMLIASGGYIGQLKENTRRIDKMEVEARAEAKARTEMLQQLDLRLARIEVKLEMMVPEKDKAR